MRKPPYAPHSPLHELRNLPPIRRLRAHAPPSHRRSRKRFPRPPPHVVTLLASAVVLCAFAALSRASFFTAQLSLLREQQPSSPSRRASAHDALSISNLSVPHLQRVSQLRRAPSATETTVIAADGSLFFVDHHALTIEQSPHVQPLSAVRMTHVVGDEHADIAFFMQISEANIPFLPRLLTVLWHPSNVYLIHFDHKIARNKTDAIRESLRRNQKFSNVHVMPSEPITYMGVSMLLNTLAAIDFLLALPHSWQYFVNLSGSDYPLVNIVNMRRILGQPHIVGRNISFLQLAPNTQFWKRTKENRFDYMFYDTSLGMRDRPKHQLLKTNKPHPIRDELGVQFLQCEAWVILHRSLARFSVRSTFARKLLILLSMMKDPEEHFFAMLAWNDPYFNSTLAHHALRGIYWKLNGISSGQHPYYIDEPLKDGSLPFWNPGVLKSRCFFARKFRNPESELLDRIDRLMSGTHSDADMHAVENSLIAVHEFVTCLSNRDPLWDKILWHPPCNYTEYRSSRKRS